MERRGKRLNMPIGGSAKAFASRENANAAIRPRLTVVYDPPVPAEDGDVPLPAWAIALLGLACARALMPRAGR